MRNVLRYLLVIMIVNCLFAGHFTASAQGGRARVENLRLDYAGGMVLIHYDLISNHAGDTSYISIFFSDAGLDNRVYPRTVSGDIGTGIVPGTGKLIVWDAAADKAAFDLPLKCNIMVNEVLGDGKTGGPAFALVSLAVPGLGDYFVAAPGGMSVKPWYRSAAALGATGLGIWSALEREDEMRLIPGHWATDVKWSTGETITTWVPDKWVISGTDYHLFPSDAEVLIGIGAAIWMADVFWVMNRGLHNQKVARLTADPFRIQTEPFLASCQGTLQYGIRFKF